MFRFFFRLYNKLYSLILMPSQHFIGRLYLKAAGVRFGSNPRLYGLPMISVYRNSQINLGNDVTLRSTSRGNAIGVNHEVILRTQNEAAIIRIGNRVGMSGGSICALHSVTIGDDVLIGSNVVIADNDFHQIAFKDRKLNANLVADPVFIENGVWIGADSYICKGVTIGCNSVIGAKSVVTKSIPPNSMAAGIPAKLIKSLSS